ncbi:MAG: acyl carrier protein [Deltaproteobacteria bacterium]|nr:acyl carrier protein [Deltaproteobacteria bacterium]MBI3295791.1 acyl carrier protein [Deltaproteobacteria bacterium]
MEINSKQKYDQAFIESLTLGPEQLSQDVAYNQTESWDSIGHMSLIAALETAFNISMDVNDITSLSSYSKGMEILKKYGIQF